MKGVQQEIIQKGEMVLRLDHLFCKEVHGETQARYGEPDSGRCQGLLDPMQRCLLKSHQLLLIQCTIYQTAKR